MLIDHHVLTRGFVGAQARAPWLDDHGEHAAGVQLVAEHRDLAVYSRKCWRPRDSPHRRCCAQKLRHVIGVERKISGRLVCRQPLHHKSAILYSEPNYWLHSSC